MRRLLSWGCCGWCCEDEKATVVDIKIGETHSLPSNHKDLNHALVLYKLGQAYENGGDGLTKDTDRALECFEAAAELGLAKAQLRVGFYYDAGIGVMVNPCKALEWYTRAALQGDNKAMFSLGLCYAKGIGIEVDNQTAFRWFSKSADLGNDRAMYNMGFCYVRSSC